MITIIADRPELVGKWITSITGTAHRPGCITAIGLAVDGILVAGAAYEEFTGKSIAMHWAVLPGKRWLTKEYLRIVFRYPFCQLGCETIVGIIAESNEQGRKFAVRLGCDFQGTLDLPTVGRLRFYELQRNNCKWLKV